MRKGPEFIRFFKPIIEILKSLDGSGNAGEVVDLVIDRMNISDEELAVQNKNGGSRVKNQVHWARNYLVNSGFIDNSERGIWSLTSEGEKLVIRNRNHALEIYDQATRRMRQSKLERNESFDSKIAYTDDEIEESIESNDSLEDYKQQLTQLLQNMPAAGFEKICQRLLRESGFKNVKVIGKSGDGGIDGKGLLEVNPLLSFKVLFQSKKYGPNKSVQPHHVRDFRGAMQGRADKGILLTTGYFTKGAKTEAIRDGVPPIELIDIDGIIELFETIGLGLTPVKTFKIDTDFFKKYYED